MVCTAASLGPGRVLWRGRIAAIALGRFMREDRLRAAGPSRNLPDYDETSDCERDYPLRYSTRLLTHRSR